MPGVPSGRGCEGCRKQKKKVCHRRRSSRDMTAKLEKCDQRRPDCSRCLRLEISCVGAGERRYKFITNHDPTILPARDDTLKPASIVVMSHSATELLVASMIQTMNPATDLKFDLAWSFGPFLELVPQRLGRNAALDAAAKAIIAAHSSYCFSSHRASPNVLLDYSRALSHLRFALNEIVTAQSLETLCAIKLLLICQVGFADHCVILSSK
jgi:hypothetical protein